MEVRRFAETHVAAHAADIDRDAKVPADVIAALGRQGYLGSRLSREQGGLELDHIGYGFLHRELGRVCSSTRSLVTVHDMVVAAIDRLGKGELRDAWLPRLVTGNAIAAFALTEPTAGSDASAVRATATPSGDEYIVCGHKRWISFAQIADVFLVVARVADSEPVVGLIVPRETPGVAITPMGGMLGLRGSMLGEIQLADCRVPKTALLGGERMPSGLATATALQLGRLGVAWGCVGLSEACLDASSEYAEHRVQFGARLADHQLVRRMLTNMATNTRAAELLCLDTATALDRRDPRAAEATLMAKYFASRVATGVASDVVQIHGALGCSDELPIERHFRDARIMEIIEGSTEIQQITIANLLRPQTRADTTPEPEGEA